MREREKGGGGGGRGDWRSRYLSIKLSCGGLGGPIQTLGREELACITAPPLTSQRGEALQWSETARSTRGPEGWGAGVGVGVEGGCKAGGSEGGGGGGVGWRGGGVRVWRACPPTALSHFSAHEKPSVCCSLFHSLFPHSI